MYEIQTKELTSLMLENDLKTITKLINHIEVSISNRNIYNNKLTSLTLLSDISYFDTIQSNSFFMEKVMSAKEIDSTVDKLLKLKESLSENIERYCEVVRNEN